MDASAIAALLFDEPKADLVADQLRDTVLSAPHLLETELANVCLSKCRRYPEKTASLLAAFERRLDLGIEMLDVRVSETLALALETGLTAYDAGYLWLARRLEAELITLDRELAAAAART